MIAPLPLSPRKSGPSRSSLIHTVVGLAFVVTTLSLGILYVLLLAPTTANSLYWPGYNASGVGTFLVDVMNDKLMTTARGSVNLLAPTATRHKAYESEIVQSDFAPVYARRVLATELNTLESAVRDLRMTTRPESINAHYCWVDLDRRWEVAHTATRARRCLERYRDNAANYIETLARNINWDDFVRVNEPRWSTIIGHALNATEAGRHWLSVRSALSKSLSVPDEVAFLAQHNLARYDLPWGNLFVSGMTELVEVQNALGQATTLLLKGQDTRYGPWTTVSLFWGFYNDLSIIDSIACSLVRSDANHFELNGWDFPNMYGYYDPTTGEHYDQVQTFLLNIGAFGAVDALNVAVPASLHELCTSFVASLFALLRSNATLLASFEELGRARLTPRPPHFDGPWTFYGGNPLCLFNHGTTYPQSSLSFDDSCSTETELAIQTTSDSAVFAWLMSGTPSVDAICALQSSHECMAVLGQVQALSKHLPPLDAILVNRAKDEVPPVEFVQYVQTDATMDWVVLHQPLISPDDPAWSFYGWVAIFDWVRGTREVVRLEGDVSSFSIMSDSYAPILLTASQDTQDSTGTTLVLYYLTAYVSVINVAVGLVTVLAVVSQLRRERQGLNLVLFNRVGSMVWIGRPLLFLRGCTAILMLSSSQTTLVFDVGYAFFTLNQRPAWATAVVAGEATWLSYVFADMLLILGSTPHRAVIFMATGGAWAATVVLDLVDPVTLTGTADRKCTAKEIDKHLHCHSGVVHVGQWSRFQVLFGIQVGSILVSLLVPCCFARRQAKPKPAPPLLLHGTTVAFLDCNKLDGTWSLDIGANVLSGLIPFSVYGKSYTFDVKLWVMVPASHATAVRPVAPHVSSPVVQNIQTTQRRSAWTMRVLAVGGLLYVVASVLGSLSYLSMSSVNLANDFYWATFNLSGHHVVIADWFNEQVPLGRLGEPSGRLDELRWQTLGLNYSDPTLRGVVFPFVAAKLHFEAANTVQHAIEGLRRTRLAHVGWIASQYCWLDFQRRWPIAHSAKRLVRCDRDSDNGAVYVESLLRNVDWNEWLAYVGDGFDIAFGQDLDQSVDGREWMALVRLPPQPVPDEVREWVAAGLRHFTVQWQNYKHPGLVNTYSIENAFGIRYPMTLSRWNGSLHVARQTSFKMYWGFASDLWAVRANATRMGGLSLIRSSGRYAFANQTMADVLVQNQTLALPMGEVLSLTQDTVGPFGVIDIKNVPCPASVRRVLATSLDSVRQSLAVHGDAYSNMTAPNVRYIKLLPSKFLAIPKGLTFGGNVFCDAFGGSEMSEGMLEFSSRTLACDQLVVSFFFPTKDMFASAVIASGVQTRSDVAAACRHDVEFESCSTKYLGESVAYVNQHVARNSAMEALVAAGVADVQAAHVTLLQFVRLIRDQQMQLMRLALFDRDDPTFFFWSWVYAFDWALGYREVISVQGDAGAPLNVITQWTTLRLQQVQAHELPTVFSTYARAGVQYITGVMLSIAVVVALYTIWSRGNVEGLNMGALNRVAGIVWVGRPLLLLRGITALCLLSTSTLELRKTGPVVVFVEPHLPWYKTILGAGEITWLVYILNDIFMVVTKDATANYASGSSVFVWLVAAVLTLVKPVTHRVTVDVQCNIDEVDFQLVCHSGVVVIGHLSRLIDLLVAVAVSNVVSYIVARIAQQFLKLDETVDSLLLSSGAKYLFYSSAWVHESVYYMDPASALLNGIITFRTTDTIHALDIKLWRRFTFVAQGGKNLPSSRRDQFRFAVPLAR